MQKILITGGSGFVGQAILRHPAFVGSLNIGRRRPTNCENFVQVKFSRNEDYAKVLDGVDVVIHTAGRAHVMKDPAENPLEEYRRVNVDVTLNLAHQAAQCGVRRFIYISSLKVLGEETKPGKAFSCHDIPHPKDAYSISKLEAEEGLRAIARETRLEVVIIRPPLMYGEGVKGNMKKLQNLISAGIPLPVKGSQNLRSLLSVDNLVDFILTCVTHANARNEIFLVSDDYDLSTSEIYSLLAESGGYRMLLFYLPRPILRVFLFIFGKKALYDRLFGSMQVDITYTKKRLEWTPPFSPKYAIKKCWVKYM